MKRNLLLSILVFVFPLIVLAQSSAKEWYNKGIELKGKQDYKGALAAFKNTILKKADYNEAYYQAGGCCNVLEKYEDAVDLLKKFTPKTDNEKKNKSNELGLSYYKLQRATEAIIA